MDSSDAASPRTSRQVRRVLDEHEIVDLDAYLASGGGQALGIAAETEPDDLVELLVDSGLRGRGGAGFPTGVKWRTIVENSADTAPPTVVVNAAEGEPGTFKDRTILRSNPYRVIEGALVAARAVGATELVIATKASFTTELERLRQAVAEYVERGLADIELRVVEGPSSYLFGEETAMLEVIEGRQPFPRVTPPYRQGLGSAPALVDNVETLANVPGIVVHGPEWFRSVGTDDSPGTIVCTVVGSTRRHGVGEFPMGTPLWDVIEELGGGPRPERTLVAAMSGTANSIVTADRFDTVLGYETMAAIGAGLGTGGFIVFDDETDLVAVAHGIAHFLAVESCGQCTPCKYDGIAIAEHLDVIRRSEASPRDVALVDHRLGTVADGARCALASQQQYAVGSIVEVARDTVRSHVDSTLDSATRFVIAPIVDIIDGVAQVDQAELEKQPDWTTSETFSGSTPVELYGTEPVELSVRAASEGAAPATPRTDRRGAGQPLPDADQDPFELVRAHHGRLRDRLISAAQAVDSDRNDEFAQLDVEVHAYLDLADRVLYPTLSRVTFASGDDVAWAAAIDAERTAELSGRLAEQAETGAAVDAAELDRLIEELAELVRCDEEVVIPVLTERLDEVRLRDLHDALVEADAAAQR